MALDGVRVHYDSPSPARVGALAYTQGTEIFVSPGQERHLPHEAWHVVQQAQGRVRPSMQLRRLPVNDDVALEREADVMSAKAMRATRITPFAASSARTPRVGRAVVQRMSIKDAFDAVEQNGISLEWYQRVVVPALSTIARKSGQTYDQYLAPLNGPQFLQAVRELETSVKQEPDESFLGGMLSVFSKADEGPVFVKSQQYAKMKRLKGTNLLVLEEGNFDSNGQPSRAVLNFAAQYQSGNLEWFRGLGVSHFAWDALRRGVVASEGTADIPTFTMDNPVATRWLPGVYLSNEARDIGLSVPQDAKGVRDLMTRMDVPTGVAIRYRVPPTAPVAFLSDGEQVVRGPLTGAHVSVYCVVTMGPGGIQYVAQNSALHNLPPAAPYQAGAGSNAIQLWEQDVNRWFASL